MVLINCCKDENVGLGWLFYAIFQSHRAHWANDSQIVLAQGTSLLAQVFKLSIIHEHKNGSHTY